MVDATHREVGAHPLRGRKVVSRVVSRTPLAVNDPAHLW
jgi:hypothetical protein